MSYVLMVETLFFSHKRADVYPVDSKVIEHSYDYVPNSFCG